MLRNLSGYLSELKVECAVIEHEYVDKGLSRIKTLMVGFGWWGCAKLMEGCQVGFRGSDPNGGVQVVGLREIMV